MKSSAYGPSSSKSNVSTSSKSSNVTDWYPVEDTVVPSKGKHNAVKEEEIDEDGPNYRSAFYDEDTCEVYEGEWLNGYRNGFGVVLYADGQLYEGNW
jgi:hypothetical protein